MHSFHIHVSARDLHTPTISLPILLLWTDPGNVEIWTEDTQFLFWKHINGIFVAVHLPYFKHVVSGIVVSHVMVAYRFFL
jgi:hypothetical protein